MILDVRLCQPLDLLLVTKNCIISPTMGAAELKIHSLICTLVLGSWFGTFLVQQENKNKMENTKFVLFILERNVVNSDSLAIILTVTVKTIKYCHIVSER